LFFSKQTISQLTPTGSKLSDRTKFLINKNIDNLKFDELSFLIREYIAIGTCIPIAINKIANDELKISLLHRNEKSESQREILRELVLLDNWYWESNTIAFKQLKGILGKNLDHLNLPKEIKVKFRSYEPQNIIWSEKSVQNFNAYMSDSRMGVYAGYNMILRIKRAILNGNTVKLIIGGEETEIQTVAKFEEMIVNKVKCNDELRELLNKEYKIKDNIK